MGSEDVNRSRQNSREHQEFSIASIITERISEALDVLDTQIVLAET